jgi:hypothetical protein
MLAAGATQALRLFNSPLFAICKAQWKIVGGGKAEEKARRIKATPVKDEECQRRKTNCKPLDSLKLKAKKMKYFKKNCPCCAG